MRIRGTILITPRVNGLILGDDGGRYDFNLLSWRADDRGPETGVRVDFESRGLQAIDVYPMSVVDAGAVQTANTRAGSPVSTVNSTPGVPTDQISFTLRTMKSLIADRWFWALSGVTLGVVLGTIVGAYTLDQISTSGESQRKDSVEEIKFAMEWGISASEVEVGQNFELTVRIHAVQRAGEHGGISVSFPSLTEPGGSTDRHFSSVADIEVLSYETGIESVTLHQPGATIYHSDDNRQFAAEHLLVEADDASWPVSADRTLVLRVTPKAVGEFEMLIRGWICADGYTMCTRVPSDNTAVDQQGWVVERMFVQAKHPRR